MITVVVILGIAVVLALLITAAGAKRCPSCRESIKRSAKVCPKCQTVTGW